MTVMWHLSIDDLRALSVVGNAAAEEEILRRDTYETAFRRGQRAGIYANNPYPDKSDNARAWGSGFEEAHD